MSADILAYDSDVVPVGQTKCSTSRSAAIWPAAFNHQFGDVFVLPKEKVLDSSARVPGIDGQKMSKSYDNTLSYSKTPRPSANGSCGS